MDAATVALWRRQLARAIAIGDHAAETILRAKLGEFAVRRMGVRPLPEMSELEKRFAWGDR